jgi:large subunit ribosomal protein L23
VVVSHLGLFEAGDGSDMLRPDLPITFIQTEHLHPRFAKFKVPLEIGKLDFRDFLYHGYSVRALNIRSWVYQRPIEHVDYRKKSTPRLNWHRRKALKYMIVEMDEPFVWPEMPKDMTPYVLLCFHRLLLLTSL